MILLNQPLAEYHAHPAIGSTTAKLAYKSIRLFRDKLDGVYDREPSTAFSIGTLIHMMVLEPSRFAEMVVTQGPINPKTGEQYGRNTKAWAEWQAENPNKIVVDPWMITMIERMPDEVRDIYNSKKGVAEESVYTHLTNGLHAKCRNDWREDTLITDLKSIDDVDNCERHIAKYQYWFSHAWYRAVMLAETGKKHQFRFVFCEKKPPFRWRIVELDADYIMYADDVVRRVIAEIDEAFKNDLWIDNVDISMMASLPQYLLEYSDAED
jgi:exodeoxyribonuclease VIII